MFVWAKICLFTNTVLEQTIYFFAEETRTRDEDGERENADRLSGLEGTTHFLDDLKFPGPMITQFEIQYSAFGVIFMEINCLFL